MATPIHRFEKPSLKQNAVTETWRVNQTRFAGGARMGISREAFTEPEGI